MDGKSSELDAMLSFWQKVLRLQDWQIDLSMVRKNELMHDGSVAQSSILETSKMVQMQVLHPEEWPKDIMVKQNHEADIVHELLHIHLIYARPKRNTPAWTRMEQAIECITTGLMSLKAYYNAESTRGEVKEGGCTEAPVKRKNRSVRLRNSKKDRMDSINPKDFE